MLLWQQNSASIQQLTDFSLPKLQVFPRQGLPGIVDVEQLHEIPSDCVGKLIYELGRPFRRPLTSFACHHTWKAHLHNQIFPSIFVQLLRDIKYAKFTPAWSWRDFSRGAGKMTVHLNRGHAPPMSSLRDFLTLFTLTCSAVNLSSLRFDVGARHLHPHSTPASFFFRELGRFWQVNRSCNLTIT